MPLSRALPPYTPREELQPSTQEYLSRLDDAAAQADGNIEARRAHSRHHFSIPGLAEGARAIKGAVVPCFVCSTGADGTLVAFAILDMHIVKGPRSNGLAPQEILFYGKEFEVLKNCPFFGSVCDDDTYDCPQLVVRAYPDGQLDLSVLTRPHMYERYRDVWDVANVLGRFLNNGRDEILGSELNFWRETALARYPMSIAHRVLREWRTYDDGEYPVPERFQQDGRFVTFASEACWQRAVTIEAAVLTFNHPFRDELAREHLLSMRRDVEFALRLGPAEPNETDYPALRRFWDRYPVPPDRVVLELFNLPADICPALPEPADPAVPVPPPLWPGPPAALAATSQSADAPDAVGQRTTRVILHEAEEAARRAELAMMEVSQNLAAAVQHVGDGARADEGLNSNFSHMLSLNRTGADRTLERLTSFAQTIQAMATLADHEYHRLHEAPRTPPPSSPPSSPPPLARRHSPPRQRRRELYGPRHVHTLSFLTVEEVGSLLAADAAPLAITELGSPPSAPAPAFVTDPALGEDESDGEDEPLGEGHVAFFTGPGFVTDPTLGEDESDGEDEPEIEEVD